MIPDDQYFVFNIEGQHYASSLSHVEEVIRAVELITLSHSPELLLGLLNIRGKFVPVFNIRKKLRLPERDIDLDDRIIVFSAHRYAIAFLVDRVVGVVELTKEKIESAQQIFPEMEHYIEGVAKFDSDTVIICNIETLFPAQEIDGLDHVVEKNV
ncbi:MAG: chemotaxis protein CheW [Thermodesulfobacteriota bacterium]|nr:chemotaxis protein CheW [Thermodesulfobacteriota bacterium]